jgi:hypothetical protein
MARSDTITQTREVFWQNVMRELLTSLSIFCSQQAARRASLAATSVAAEGAAAPGVAKEADASITGAVGMMLAQASPLSIGDPASDEDDEEGTDAAEFEVPESVGSEPGNIFDGRLAVITSLGQRVSIAEVHPVFACGVPGPHGPNLLSSIVECSVFEIRTPGGEVYTLPIHEIKAFHALTPELVEELGKAVGVQEKGNEEHPFGFAAFTSLARNQGALSDVPQVEREWLGE